MYKLTVFSPNFSSENALRGIGYVRRSPNGSLTGVAVQINNELGDIGVQAAEFLEFRVTAPNGISYLHSTFTNR